jgi:type IV secretion system protein VirB4
MPFSVSSLFNKLVPGFSLSFEKTEREKHCKQEISIADFIPYSYHWNKHTLMTKKNELMQVIKVGGFSFETADDEDVDMRKTIRNMLFKGMASGKFTVYIHTIRRRQPLRDDIPLTIDPNIKLNNDFASYVDREWKKKHINQHGFVNEIYITIIRKADTKGAAILEHLFKKVQHTDKKAWENDMRESYSELEEMTNRILTTLRDYNAELLGIQETPLGPQSEILQFLQKIISPAHHQPITVPTTSIDHYLACNRIFFGSKSIDFHGANGNKLAAMVSIKEYGPMTSAGMFDGFLQMPFEFVMTQSFSFANRQIAIDKMQLQQNRMIQAEDKAISQIVEISEALDMATSGEIGFGEHHLTIMCLEETQKSLDNAVSLAVVALSNCGINGIRERINMEPAFWAQFPGNSDYIVRKSIINTLNLASFSSFHNYPTGKKYGNHWGEFVTIFDTTSGTPYYFNFHLRDVGHTLIIGPTGSGKTVLMNFLCAEAQKFKCRMFFFDKDRGAEIFIRALNGVHTHLDPSQSCGFNPLQLPDTGENRTFLLDWLKSLVSQTNQILTAHEMDLLAQAVAGNYKLAPQDRKLRNIAPFLGLSGPETLAGRLAMWHSNGSHAHIFDNDYDALDFDISRIFGFEMGELLKDQISLAPVLLYLFHRIQISLNGTPTMIVLDEAWALIDNKVFGPKIKDWLKVLRKLNTFVIFATQSVEDASKSAISDTLIQQTATQIFLPNLKATDIYRHTFMLTEREYTLIKTTDPGSRFFLIKQGTNALVARIDLDDMPEVIHVLSGRAETVGLLDDIRSKVGNDPERWLPLFQKAVKDHNDKKQNQ